MENALTGIAAGASLVGLKPVIVHARNDFALLALDQLINVYSKWQHMYDGNAGSISVITRALIGRGWGQGATHSQSIQSILGHFPGLRVVMPATPLDAKGMFLAAVSQNDPVVILEHRNLFHITENIETDYYETPLIGAKVLKIGTDVTIVAMSVCVQESIEASEFLVMQGISIEVIDIRSIQPLDFNTIHKSIIKTKHLIIADTSWTTYGVSAEIAARITELEKFPLDKPIIRLGQFETPAPVSAPLESNHHPSVQQIINSVFKILGKTRKSELVVDKNENHEAFRNPY
jgi:pyruvate dehydrogenase E1 component beta subunit